MNRYRVAVLNGIPAPYREPVFETLAAHPEVELKVFYCSPGHAEVGWTQSRSRATETPYTSRQEFLTNWSPRWCQRRTLFGYANLAIGRRLRQFRPDYVIIYGYNQLTYLLAMHYCVRYRVPFALRGDSNARIDQSRTLASLLRRKLVRQLVHRAHAVLPVGTANAEFWMNHGAKASQLFDCPFSVFNTRIAELATRQPIDLHAPIRFLYAGRMIARKEVPAIIQAFNTLSKGVHATLSLVGDGPDRPVAEAMVAEHARPFVQWHGRLSNDDTMKQMGSSDVLVIPARTEPWGLVVNEAMAAGLSVIARHDVGAAIDLVEEGVTGRLLADSDPQTIAESMLHACLDPAATRAQGAAACQKIQSWSLEATVEGMLAAIRDAACGLTKDASRARGSSLSPVQSVSLMRSPPHVVT